MPDQTGQPFRTLGFQTSIDIARQQSYHVTQLAGKKRRPSQYPEDDRQDSNTKQPATSGAVLPRQVTTVSRGVDFAHSPVIFPKGRLVASEVNPAPVSSSGENGQDQKSGSTHPEPVQNTIIPLKDPRFQLPPALVANYEAAGVGTIYPWQASCLLGRGLLDGKSHLVYTAPTGGGKSLVAEVLMLKRIIDNPSRKAILVLPYVALVQEKLKWLRRLVQDVEKCSDPHYTGGGHHQGWKKFQKSIRVTGFFGGNRTTTSWTDIDIAVCTIEKANSLINTAIEECLIGELGVVVLDELHMLDDEHRGYLLELMVTKLLLLQQDIQIIGMSATISNTESLAEWMNAKYFISTYRPVPVDEYLVYDNAVYPASTSRQLFQTISRLSSIPAVPALTNAVQPHCTIKVSTFRELANPMTNSMVALAIDTVSAGYGVLVFCGSRQACQLQAAVIGEAMPDPSTMDINNINTRLDLLADLRSLPSGLDPALETTLIKGVGFHHAGMTTEERELIAQAYDRGVVKVLVATCSLAAGVNLPARRVIIYGARMGRELVGPAMLRQMCGRAGRKGKDDAGETYLICGKSDLQAVCDLLEADMPAIASCLAPEKRGLKRALLEAITTGLVSGYEAIKEYVKCTLLYRTMDKKLSYGIMNFALEELTNEGLLRLNDDNGAYVATQLGQAIVFSGFAPEEGLFIFEELKRALQAFVMDGDMHIFYMFTPFQVAETTQINWSIFRDQLDNLDESGLRALQFVGVQPGFVNTMVQRGASLKENTAEQINQAKIYRRAYTAFQLRDLCNEVPLPTIAARYQIARGVVQSLAQQCHGFAAGMVKFCQRMGWGMFAAVLDHMRDRLEAGARADLLEMTQVTYVKGWTARLLRDNGFRNLRALAEADANDIVPVLMMVNSRKTQKNQLHPAEAERYAQKLLAKAEAIVASANKIWEREMQVELDE